MHYSRLLGIFSFTLLLLAIQLPHSYAQELTRIWGQVFEDGTEEPIPYVNISFKGTTIGTVSDGDGKFYLETTEATESLKASFIGYEPAFKNISIGKTQHIKFTMKVESMQLEDVVVTGVKLRYRNKNNPAVDMIKNILDHKESNKPTALDYFEYDKYEKVEFDLNNITDKFRNKRIMKNFQLIFDYVDTSDVNGKTYLPIFLRETSSHVYYRKDPAKEIEYKKGEKMTGFEDYFDNQGISSLLDKMYQEVDIYDNSVNVLTQKFVSPISSIGPITYKYFIEDTLNIEGEKLFKLSFRPRNENNLTFVGSLYVTTDSAYAVRKVDMKLSNNANLNFVDDLYIEQEFKKNQFGTYDLIVDRIDIDFNLLNKNGLGMFGKRTVSYRDLQYNVPREDDIYKGVNTLVIDPESTAKDENFWADARHMGLSRSEEGVFEMIEEVKSLPAFKRIMDILTFVLVGYVDLGKVEIGPVGSFYSWNEIEGARFRFGGKTTKELSEKYIFEGYGAYGTKDEEWKYQGIVSHHINKNPANTLRATYERDIENPGESLQFSNDDNVLLSARRGKNDRRIYYYKYQFEYLKTLGNGFSMTLGMKNMELEPAGLLRFDPGDIAVGRNDFITRSERKNQQIDNLESNISIRFAPNEQFYQGEASRTQIINKHPIFTVTYDRGFKDIVSSDYSYDKLSLGVFKRTYLPPLGYFDTEVEARKIWGTVPYPLLNIPAANQTFSYQIRAYNLMNILEYVSDEYVSVQYAHYFNGYLLNKVPLIKQLKWRSLITFKGLFGRLTDANNPELPENDTLPQLPAFIDDDGNFRQLTHPLSAYIETSIGVSNIFKFFRVDLVKRWTELDNPDAARGIHFRVRAKIEF